MTAKQRYQFIMSIKVPYEPVQLDEFESGVLVGVLIGEGSFTGDRNRPAVSIKMSERHTPMLRWFEARVPGSRLTGPYHYPDPKQPRRQPQVILRIAARGLRESLIPLLELNPWGHIDPHSYERFLRMRRKYEV
jgi:hypothetical protein